MSTKSIFSRPVDLLYFIFFTTHIPIILSSIQASKVSSLFLTEFYIASYQDRLFTAPPPWFMLFQAIEAVVQIPMSVWLARGLLRQDVRVPVVLLVFAVQCCVTTATCLVDLWAWQGYDTAQRTALAGLYSPYLALGLLMGLDAFTRLTKVLTSMEVSKVARKQE